MFRQDYIDQIVKQMAAQEASAYEQSMVQLLMNLSNTVERLALAIEMNTVEMKKRTGIIT